MVTRDLTLRGRREKTSAAGGSTGASTSGTRGTTGTGNGRSSVHRRTTAQAQPQDMEVEAGMASTTPSTTPSSTPSALHEEVRRAIMDVSKLTTQRQACSQELQVVPPTHQQTVSYTDPCTWDVW